MSDALLLALALFSSLCGMAWLALAMEPHWRQVCACVPPGVRCQRLMRCAGGAALTASLWFCLEADHPSMAVLVWVMALAAAALAVAFTLAWRPRLLLPWALCLKC